MPERWPDLASRYGYDHGFVRLDHYSPCRARMMIGDRVFREIEDNCWDPERRLGYCDSSGVAIQVLSTVPVMFCYWTKPADGLDLSRLLNDHIAGVVERYPARFRGLGTVPLQDPDLACREMERCVRELGLSGLQIGSHVNGWNLDEPALFPFFQRARDLNVPIFVHPWEMAGKDRMPKYFLPWLVGMPGETTLAICSLIFGGVLDRLAGLRICFAHGGGAFPYTLPRIEHGFRTRPDLCAVNGCRNPRSYVGSFYVDSLVHDPGALRYLISVMGAERIALGSDYPFPLGEALPGSVIEALQELAPGAKERMLSGTALEFLGMRADAGAGAARKRRAE